jgi:hypothetical protein
MPARFSQPLNNNWISKNLLPKDYQPFSKEDHHQTGWWYLIYIRNEKINFSPKEIIEFYIAKLYSFVWATQYYDFGLAACVGNEEFDLFARLKENGSFLSGQS